MTHKRQQQLTLFQCTGQDKGENQSNKRYCCGIESSCSQASKDSACGQASDGQSNYISIQSPYGPTTVIVNSSKSQVPGTGHRNSGNHLYRVSGL